MEGFKQVTENAYRAVYSFLDILQAPLMQMEILYLCLMYCEYNQYYLLQSAPFFIRSGSFSFIASCCFLLQQKERRPHFGLTAPINKMALLAL